jgi:RNA polymerase sigma-70 factor (ECF subfamily)
MLSTVRPRATTLLQVDTEHAPGSTREAYPSSVVDGCRRGDRAALERVFRAEAPYLERVLYRVLGPSSDREDMLQSTLEQAIRAFPHFRSEASVRTWLTRIAVRTAMHHLRHPAQQRRVGLELIEGGLAGPSRAADELDARVQLRVLYEHLDKLDAKQRTAFVLFQVEQRSMDEVAALMDSGVSTTKSRVMWARRKLYARLSKDPRAHGLLATLRDAGAP